MVFTIPGTYKGFLSAPVAMRILCDSCNRIKHITGPQISQIRTVLCAKGKIVVLIVGAVYAGMIRCQRIIPLTFYIVVKRRQFVDFTALRTGCAGIILIQQLDFIVPNTLFR